MYRDFFGFRMQQSDSGIFAFNLFFNILSARGIRFRRIIELGTGYGGFTVLLGLYGLNNNCNVHTIDKNNLISEKALAILNFLKVGLLSGDMESDTSAIEQIRYLISSGGRSLVLCDGGDKVKEFNLYVPSLKAGDFIMAHDYVETYEKFLTEYNGKIWDYCDITLSDVDDSCHIYSLEPFMQDIFDTCVWLCRTRLYK